MQEPSESESCKKGESVTDQIRGLEEPRLTSDDRDFASKVGVSFAEQPIDTISFSLYVAMSQY